MGGCRKDKARYFIEINSEIAVGTRCNKVNSDYSLRIFFLPTRVVLH